MSRQHPTLPTQRSPAGLPAEHSTHSFWHTQPSPLLTAHRSTRNLPQTADVVVIGSGVTGTSAAWHLLTTGAKATGGHGPKVVMLEAREACWGATGRNGGHCQPLLFEAPHDPSIGHFELANFHDLQRLITERDIDCDFVAQPGVRAIYSQHHLEEAEEALSIMEHTAPELRRMMKIITDKKKLAEFRIPSATCAIVTKFAARLWPYKFVAHLLEHLLTSTELNGSFNLQTLTPATALAPSKDVPGWTITTSRGSISARKVILATNAYTSHLLPWLADFIVPCRGQMSALHPLPSLRGDDRLKTSLGFLGDGLDDYLIQRPNETGGHLMFGGGRQHGPSIGVTDDSVLDQETAQYLRSRLVTALGLPEGEQDPQAEFKAANEWTGIMGFSRDERPWVGPVPFHFSTLPNPHNSITADIAHPGLYLSAGYTGHGMPNTWLCGKAIALMARKALELEVDVGPGRKRFVVDEEWVVEQAAAEVGLPAAYRVTEERLQRAAGGESVEAREWAEMRRDGRRQSGQERPASGYA